MSGTGGATTIIQWRMLGSRNWMNGRFMSAFDALKGDSTWSAEYISILADITETYKNDVMDRWKGSHDRTGETLSTFNVETGAVSAFETQLKVVVGGNVGFVINPLPAHWISPVNTLSLAGPEVPSWRYSEFGPRKDVYWFQGGPESYNPDMTWFQDASDSLAGLGAAGLQRVAGMVKEEVLGLLMVDGELVSGTVEMNWDL